MANLLSGIKSPSSNAWLMLASLAISATFMILLCWFFEPIWTSNDDVGMSMRAHGYGQAAVGSHYLIYSNVLWGYLVRAIPEINGILGYSSATLGVLVIVGAILLFGMVRLGIGYVAALSVFVLLLTIPVLSPQFTINSGFLLIGAVVCWRLFAQWEHRWMLLSGCLLAFSSYLVRDKEFLLMLGVALPLLPWRTLLLRRSSQVAFSILFLMIVMATAFDHQAQQEDGWKTFNEFNSVRNPFTDFGIGESLKQRPDILKRYGYSANDIDLLSNWFFADPEIANPQVLNAMLSELGPVASQENSLNNAWLGVQTLWHPILLPLLLAALLLAALRPSWPVAASWGLCIAAILLLGLMGRPGILRVYVPLLSLLVIAPLLANPVSGWRPRLVAATLLLAAVMNAFRVFPMANSLQIEAAQIRTPLITFPTYPVVVWADSFPYEAVYPFLSRKSSPAMSFQFYHLGGSTLSPGSVAYAEQLQGRGLIDRLVDKEGVPVIAHDYQMGYLGTYCWEHLHGRLVQLSFQKYGIVAIRQLRCDISP